MLFGTLQPSHVPTEQDTAGSANTFCGLELFWHCNIFCLAAGYTLCCRTPTGSAAAQAGIVLAAVYFDPFTPTMLARAHTVRATTVADEKQVEQAAADAVSAETAARLGALPCCCCCCLDWLLCSKQEGADAALRTSFVPSGIPPMYSRRAFFRICGSFACTCVCRLCSQALKWSSFFCRTLMCSSLCLSWSSSCCSWSGWESVSAATCLSIPGLRPMPACPWRCTVRQQQ